MPTQKTKSSTKSSLLTKAKNALMGSMRSAKSHGKAATKSAPAKVAAKKAAPAPVAPPSNKKTAAPAPAGKKGAAPVKAATTPAKSPAPAAKSASAKASAQQRRQEAALAKAQTHHDDSVCREVACEGLSTTAGYCRMHYIKNWKKIKRKEIILKEGKLNQYIEELVAKYPDKYIEAIRQDLASDKDFAQVIYDLDLDESIDDFDVEGEGVEGIIDSIKRDFDDEGDSGF